ncbi:hypothetical protein HPB47_016580 [Ixodes persulcatus]|uniref:Uncharacterized protein n=1 Tax=Ixodes persulcatus TaxID=34615 RepID=A0AC60QQI8_IXOPE|nr:hypothetical protein HPB47_016580 [Ixodes persulcatus]
MGMSPWVSPQQLPASSSWWYVMMLEGADDVHDPVDCASRCYDASDALEEEKCPTLPLVVFYAFALKNHLEHAPVSAVEAVEIEKIKGWVSKVMSRVTEAETTDVVEFLSDTVLTIKRSVRCNYHIEATYVHRLTADVLRYRLVSAECVDLWE